MALYVSDQKDYIKGQTSTKNIDFWGQNSTFWGENTPKSGPLGQKTMPWRTLNIFKTTFKKTTEIELIGPKRDHVKSQSYTQNLPFWRYFSTFWVKYTGEKEPS